MKCIRKPVIEYKVMELRLNNIDEVIDFVGSKRYIPENLKSECNSESDLEFVIKYGIGVRDFSSYQTANIGDFILENANGYLEVYSKEMFHSKFNIV